LSRSEDKRSKAMAAGADEFYACLGNAEATAELAGKFDVIIDTSPANSDVGAFNPIDGTFYLFALLQN